MATSNAEWAAKLSDMEQWYRDLLRDHGVAGQALEDEYAPHAAFLGRLSGRVLDVGGGAGPTGRYLQPGCSYIVVDPSTLWASPEWRSFGESFRGTGVAAEHIVGVGEALPFPDASFDAVLSMWSLNHAQDWRRCVREMARVAKSGAPVYLVLEDMEPSWRDIARAAWQRVLTRVGIRLERTHFHNEKVGAGLKKVVRGKLRGGWPVQDDHVAIDERALRREVAGRLRLARRSWKDGFLTLAFDKAR